MYNGILVMSLVTLKEFSGYPHLLPKVEVSRYNYPVCALHPLQFALVVFFPLAQTLNLHLGSLHCVLVVWWW